MWHNHPFSKRNKATKNGEEGEVRKKIEKEG